MIKAVVFDLDDTLYDQRMYYAATCRRFALEQKLDAAELIKQFHLIYGKTNDVFGDILKAVGQYSGEKQNSFFKIYCSVETKLQMFPDALELINWLKEKKVLTGIITNGVLEVQRNKIKSLNVESEFDSIIYARAWGKEMEKPHVKPFYETMEKLSCKPDELIYVGDTLETDIKGALDAGIKQVFLLDRNRSNLKFSGIRIIGTLNEIKSYYHKL